MGGGLTCLNASDMQIYNSIFWNNESPKGAEIAVATKAPAILSIQHSDLEGGETSIYVEPGHTLHWGQGMIDADPLFIDPNIDDLHIRYDSPCRDAGIHGGSFIPPVDFDGNPRIAYGFIDMGADEFYAHLYQTGEALPNHSIAVHITGPPKACPIGLWLSTGRLMTPIHCPWGAWYLAFPVSGPMDLGPIPSPEGVIVLPGTVPSAPPGPYALHLQALIINELTQPLILTVK
jgi:hypothetical protein